MTVFVTWTKDGYQETDARGKPIPIVDVASGLAMESIPNKYGRVPYVLLRIGDVVDDSGPTGGMLELIEEQVRANMYGLTEDTSILDESFGVWLGVNLQAKDQGDGSTKTIGKGRAHFVEGVGSDFAPPSLEHVTAVGQYTAIGEQRKDHIKEAMREEGLPADIVNDEGSAPPSGIARQLARQELLETRGEDLLAVIGMEADLYALTALVWNQEVSPALGEPELDPDLTIEIDYAEEAIILEQDQRLTLNAKRVLTGAMTIGGFLKVETGFDGALSDTEAVANALNSLAVARPLLSVLAAIAGIPIEAIPVDATTVSPAGTSAQQIDNSIVSN